VGEALALSGLVPSIGSLGDACGDDPAETTIGLYRNEAVCDDSPIRRGPLHRLAEVELLTADWCNTDGLMHRLGRSRQSSTRLNRYAATTAPSAAAHQ
jgi:putative transposase